MWLHSMGSFAVERNTCPKVFQPTLIGATQTLMRPPPPWDPGIPWWLFEGRGAGVPYPPPPQQKKTPYPHHPALIKPKASRMAARPPNQTNLGRVRIFFAGKNRRRSHMAAGQQMGDPKMGCSGKMERAILTCGPSPG